MEEFEANLSKEAEGHAVSKEWVERGRLREKEEWEKPLTIEKLGRKKDLAKWKGEVMKELELEGQLWKRKVEKLQNRRQSKRRKR